MFNWLYNWINNTDGLINVLQKKLNSAESISTISLDGYDEAELSEAFLWAVRNDLLVVVERFLEDVRLNPSVHNNYAIREAAYFGCYTVVKRLLQDKRVNPADYDNLAFIIAAENGHLAVVELFLQDKRINPADKNNQALINAANNGHHAVADRLLQDERVDFAANYNEPILRAAYNCHALVVLRLLKYPGQLTFLINRLPDTWEMLNQFNLKALSAELPCLQFLPSEIINIIMNLCNPITKAYPLNDHKHSSILNAYSRFANKHKMLEVANKENLMDVEELEEHMGLCRLF